MISYTEQAVNGVPNVLLLFFSFLFLFQVNKGGKSVSTFHVSGNFYHLSRIYGRFGFSYVWFGAFFFSSRNFLLHWGYGVYLVCTKGGFFHERDDVNDCLYVHSLFCVYLCVCLICVMYWGEYYCFGE